jgi:PAS domain S-box-containing protein
MDSLRRFQELADTAPVLIWRADADRKFSYVNLPWLQFTGRGLAQELGDGWLDGVHNDDRERRLGVFQAAFDNQREFSIDYRLRRHDGVFRWIIDNGRPIFTADGAFAGYLGSCVDITDRKEAEVRAVRALADARRAIRQRDVLLGEVHHRVKNNLQVILSLLGLKARRAPDARVALDSVARRIQALGIIQQELHEDQDVSNIGLLSFVRRLSRPMALLYGAERGEVRVEGTDAPFDLHSAGVVGIVVAELLSNAFNHAFEGGYGCVTITVESGQDGSARIVIHDSGPGFDENAVGTGGIGLVLVRNFARQADIAVTLDEGPGARWTLALPPPGEDV